MERSSSFIRLSTSPVLFPQAHHLRLQHQAFCTMSTSPSSPMIDLKELNDFVKMGRSNDKDIKFRVDKIRPDGSYVCKSTAPLKKNNVIYTVPLGVCLGIERAATIFGSAITSAKLRTGELGLLALMLLYEKQAGSKSKYATYIKSLPPQAPGVLSWTSDLLEELEKSTTRKITSQLKAVEVDATMIDMLSSQLPNVFPPQTFNKENFKWAMGIVKAKNILLDGKPHLVPGMDLIDFDPLSSAEPFTASAGAWGGKEVKLLAERNYDEGEELVMSYGLKSSAECLEDHGFVPDIALDDACCELAVNIDGSERFADDKLGILERAGYGKTAVFDLESDPSAEIDNSLLQFLRLKLIEGKDSFILESCFMGTVFVTMSMPFSKANEIKVFEYLANKCQSMLDGMIQTTEEEDALTCKTTTGPKAEMARLRLQEKAALVATLNKVKQELNLIQTPGDTREYYQERRLRELDLLRPLDESEIFLDDRY